MTILDFMALGVTGNASIFLVIAALIFDAVIIVSMIFASLILVYKKTEVK